MEATIKIGSIVRVRGMRCEVTAITRGGVRVATIPTPRMARCEFTASFKEIKAA